MFAIRYVFVVHIFPRCSECKLAAFIAHLICEAREMFCGHSVCQVGVANVSLVFSRSCEVEDGRT